MSSRTKSVLTQSEADLLGALAEKYGAVVTFEQIFCVLKKKKSRQEVRDIASKMKRNGWLFRLKKGVYALSGLEERGNTALSQLIIAQALDARGYVSCEAALQYHDMFDQFLRTIRVATRGRHKFADIGGIRYEYMTTVEKYFYGFEERWDGERLVRVATIEKALLDMLHFSFSVYTVDVVLEKLREYRNNIDQNRLEEFLIRQTIKVQRVMGFLLDQSGFDTTTLRARLSHTLWRSRMMRNSKKYIKKWRLYVDDRFSIE